MHRKLLIASVACYVSFGSACRDATDAASDAGTAGMPVTSAGTGAAGGPSGAGGAGSGGAAGATVAGASGAGGAPTGDVYTCKPPAPEPGGTKAMGQSCCGGLGTCSKGAGGSSAAYGVDECKPDLKCAPSAAGFDDAGISESETCKVELPPGLVGNTELEGRCVPNCFTSGDTTTGNLGQSSCDKGSKCVPCYSPVTGASTGACEQAGDKPKQPAPPAFPSCGDSSIGYCVLSTAVMPTGNVMLPQLTCPQGQVCAPKQRVLDSRACFAHCESAVGGPGACIANFLVPESSRALLMPMTCSPGELCVPCINPLDMTTTGACN